MVQNVPPTQAWEALREDSTAQLVDVRTDAEWNFIGVPDLNAAGKRAVLIPWQLYPTMQKNRSFIEDLNKVGLTPDHKLYFICRSGARSMLAAEAAQEAGFKNVFNVVNGFEGPQDADGHRGQTAGWKADGLPWVQS